MNNIEKDRIQAKLDLWNARGFFWFLQDLEAQKGTECAFMQQVDELFKQYKSRIKELGGDIRYTQTHLPGLEKQDIIKESTSSPKKRIDDDPPPQMLNPLLGISPIQ